MAILQYFIDCKLKPRSCIGLPWMTPPLRPSHQCAPRTTSTSTTTTTIIAITVAAVDPTIIITAATTATATAAMVTSVGIDDELGLVPITIYKIVIINTNRYLIPTNLILDVSINN